MQVKVRRFLFPSDQDGGYLSLMQEVQRRGIHVHQVLHNGELPEDGATYTIDPHHLFNNQSNTVEGFRIFDCYIGLIRGGRDFQDVRQGYILEDDEGFAKLQELRNQTYVCGYCGNQTLVSSHEGDGP